MTLFDKICASFSIILGLLVMAMGALGFLLGGNANANITLPPILGGLPFFLGWGMSVPLIKCWAGGGSRSPERKKVGRRAHGTPPPVFKMPEMPAGH